MREMPPVIVAVLAGMAFAMAWLVASVSYSYLTDGDVSSSTLAGAMVAGTVFGTLNYLYGRRS